MVIEVEALLPHGQGHRVPWELSTAAPMASGAGHEGGWSWQKGPAGFYPFFTHFARWLTDGQEEQAASCKANMPRGDLLWSRAHRTPLP